ncbi:MAG: NAD(P)/FAD-dependent oxidoreductase [Parachlamydiaceae bacterium]|nr:NAD(P)/FAD-dependent oxidoreductase [Parachlamydiaceae bacterium]
MTTLRHLVIGGGAAGFFGAISCAQHFPDHSVKILEKNRQLLSKVKISGGGRCNVTHACFEPSMLVKNYPRGFRELMGPFSRFQPRDTVQWFESRGVLLKTEEDGRMFPVSDQSESIINCLLNEAKQKNIEICLEHGIESIDCMPSGFSLTLSNGHSIECDRLLIATGSHPKIYSILEKLGHSTIPLVPSLFTFNLPDSPFLELSGVSVEVAEVSLPQFNVKQMGPVLFTHWGLSGPVVLKLSAWAARELHQCEYQTEVKVNWVPHLNEASLKELLLNTKKKWAVKYVGTESPVDLPKQLWKKMVSVSGIKEEERWSNLSNLHLQKLIEQLRSTSFKMKGKTTYKQEFVTCGGVPLNEVNFKTMESRVVPGLFFGGEVLNIDGITGGFNFQNAWTTGWIAGQSMGR